MGDLTKREVHPRGLSGPHWQHLIINICTSRFLGNAIYLFYLIGMKIVWFSIGKISLIV